MDTTEQKSAPVCPPSAGRPFGSSSAGLASTGTDAPPLRSKGLSGSPSNAKLPRTSKTQRIFGRQIFPSAIEQRLIASLILALTTVLLYIPVTHAPFLNLDDREYTTQNAHVMAGMHWSTVRWAISSTEKSNWQPVTWLSHTLDYRWFGTNPSGRHTNNVLIHAINAVLLFLILASATGLLWRSLAVAALFALHPINVESVTWIAQRNDVLSTLFFLLALGAYGWYARRPNARRYIAVTVAFALGLMTDPQVITLPFALLLMDYWPLRRLRGPGSISAPHSPKKLVVEKLPWFAMSAAIAVIAKKAAGATETNLPVSIRIENAALSYVKYLGKAFWPANLAPMYPHPMHSINVAAALAAAAAIIGITVLAVIYRQHRPLFVGWFWFLGTMLPMIGLVQFGVQGMADRFAYIPLMGIFVIVCWGVAELVPHWNVPRLVPVAGTMLVLVSLAAALHRQEGFWKDNVKLWTHTVEVTDRNYKAEDQLGTALAEAGGKVNDAMAHFQRAHLYQPDDPLSSLSLAVFEHMQKHYAAAEAGYTHVLAVTNVSRYVKVAQLNRGYTRYALKRYEEAHQDFAAALAEQPDNSDVYRGLGLVAQKRGNLDEAIKEYERSLDLEHTGSGYLLLSQALELAGKKDEAAVAASKARVFMALKPKGGAALVSELLQ